MMPLADLQKKYPLNGDKYHNELVEEMVANGALWCCATNYCEQDEMCYCDDEDHA